MDAIYGVNFRYQLNIYRQLRDNKIAVVESNTFNNLPSLYGL
jgi:hypothetical protein